MTFRDQLDRFTSTRIATRYSNPKYTKQDREQMEKKYQKKKKFHQSPRKPSTFDHISRYVNQRNVNRIFDTMDSITQGMPQPNNSRPKYSKQPKNVSQGIMREDNSNERFGYDMFNPKKKKDSDFFKL